MEFPASDGDFELEHVLLPVAHNNGVAGFFAITGLHRVHIISVPPDALEQPAAVKARYNFRADLASIRVELEPHPHVLNGPAALINNCHKQALAVLGGRLLNLDLREIRGWPRLHTSKQIPGLVNSDCVSDVLAHGKLDPALAVGLLACDFTLPLEQLHRGARNRIARGPVLHNGLDFPRNVLAEHNRE